MLVKTHFRPIFVCLHMVKLSKCYGLKVGKYTKQPSRKPCVKSQVIQQEKSGQIYKKFTQKRY